MWLLIAELRKLVRPLVWGTVLASAGFCVLLVWGATSNASQSLNPGASVSRDCLVSPTTAACQAAGAQDHQFRVAQTRATNKLERPGAIGQVAAGLMSSLPGVFVVALLAGGHWGGEWSGRTVRALFTREGRRVRVLAAKWASLWVAAVVAVLVCWATLAVAGPLLATAYSLPAAGVPLWHGFGASLAAFGHALVILALFSAVGVAAGVIARGQLACTAATGGVLVVTLIVAGFASVGRWSPATFVQAWMQFQPSSQYLPTNFWARFLSGRTFSEPVGLVGVVAWIGAAGLIAARRVVRDVNV
jgi:ABC-type transport system involved in multi-copper enzyme maturation permease subunit